jgi:hypothetical protein
MRTPFPEARIEEVPETRIEEAGGKAAILLAAHKAGHGRRIEEAGGKAAILLAAHKAGHGRRIEEAGRQSCDPPGRAQSRPRSQDRDRPAMGGYVFARRSERQ